MTPTLHDEHELLSRLKNGDEEAFASIYSFFWKPVFAIAANKLKDLQEAEEVVQEIFLDIWHRREDLTIQNSLSAYLAGCVKYKLLTLFAKKAHAMRYQNFMAARPYLDFSTERAA